MPAIVFPISSAPGVQPQEGSGRIINGYAVKQEQGSRSPFKWGRSAGLREVSDILNHVHCRGFIFVGSTLIVVLGQRVYSVTLSGTTFTATNLGELTGTDTVTIARNNHSTPKIVAVTSAGMFNLFTDSAPTAFADTDLPSSNSVAGLNGYLIFTTGSGDIWATGLNALTVATDAFTSAQVKPDGLRRGVSYRGEYFAFGDNSIQVYDDAGTTPFPLQYKTTIPRGLCGTHAVAGFEDGWANRLIWAGEDNIVYELDGYEGKPVSNDDVSRAIRDAGDQKTLIEACVYMDGKNAIFSLTLPGVWTWEYNVTTGAWNERKSYQREDWRGRRTIHAFDRWIVGDDETGKLAEIDSTYFQEYGGPLVLHLESGDNANFPYRLAIGWIALDFVAALGNAAGSDPIETDPVVMISWSLDGGHTWGNEVRRALGKQGESGKLVRVNVHCTTKGKGFRLKVQVSDPVHVGFLGGQMPDVKAMAA